MRRGLWITVVFLAAGALLCGIGGIVICEGAIRVPHHAVGSMPIAGRAVEITASDGAVLRGWLLSPEHPNGDCVIALHGIADTRSGALGLARLFLDHGYTVLIPDNRGHGESGGDIITYGLRETGDVHQWVDWLERTESPRNVFGIGESLGGAVLLESLAVEPRFSAVVAECSFATFQGVAVERVAQKLPVPAGIGKLLAEPLVWSAFFYARSKYGVDYRGVSPLAAVEKTSTPILLIHGLADDKTSPAHSQRLAAANPRAVTLWLVPNAGHIGAYGAAPDEFARRVLNWFSTHARN